MWEGRAVLSGEVLWGQSRVRASPSHLESMPGCHFPLAVFLFICLSGWGTQIAFLCSTYICHIPLLSPLLILLPPSSDCRGQCQHIRCMIMATVGALAHCLFLPGFPKTLAMTIKPFAWKVWAGGQCRVVQSFLLVTNSTIFGLSS